MVISAEEIVANKGTNEYGISVDKLLQRSVYISLYGCVAALSIDDGTCFGSICYVFLLRYMQKASENVKLN